MQLSLCLSVCLSLSLSLSLSVSLSLSLSLTVEVVPQKLPFVTEQDKWANKWFMLQTCIMKQKTTFITS
jgi:hypothetical protein